MVIGAERMREVNNLEATDFVATLTHPMAEYIYGVTLPSLPVCLPVFTWKNTA
jgi:acetyl-CoA C-acetyltransferase